MNKVEELRQKHLRRWANIPRQFTSVRLNDYDPEFGDEAVYHKVCDYLDDIDLNLATGLGICLIGPPGLGKTYLTCGMLNHLLDWGKAVRFEPLADYIEKKKEAIQLERALEKDPSDHDVARQLRELWQLFSLMEGRREGDGAFSVVALDDVGKEYRTASGYAAGEFDRLLRTRYLNQRPTLITSNLPLRDWDTEYSPSMKSYVQEACLIISITGDDYRARINRGRRNG